MENKKNPMEQSKNENSIQSTTDSKVKSQLETNQPQNKKATPASEEDEEHNEFEETSEDDIEDTPPTSKGKTPPTEGKDKKTNL